MIYSAGSKPRPKVPLELKNLEDLKALLLHKQNAQKYDSYPKRERNIQWEKGISRLVILGNIQWVKGTGMPIPSSSIRGGRHHP